MNGHQVIQLRKQGRKGWVDSEREGAEGGVEEDEERPCNVFTSEEGRVRVRSRRLEERIR